MQDQIQVIRDARKRDKRLLGMQRRGRSIQDIADSEKISRQRAAFLLKRAAGRNGA